MKINEPVLKGFLWTVLLTGLIIAFLPYSALAAGDQVLAKVGKRTITETDLQQLANAVPEKVRHLYLTPEGRKKTLDYIVNVYVLAAEAENQGLDKSPEVQKLLDFSQQDLLARLYLDKITDNLPDPTEQEAKQYFDKNRAQYTAPESIHLRHILVKTEKEANKVLERLKKGDKFADVAQQVSTCPSKGRGGDLDWLPKGTLLPEIEQVAFSMQEGQTTGPVKSTFGYHVLMLEGKRPAQETDFDQVKDYIVEQLKFQKRQEYYEKVAEQLRQKMKVQVAEAPTAAPAPATEPAGPASGK